MSGRRRAGVERGRLVVAVAAITASACLEGTLVVAADADTGGSSTELGGDGDGDVGTGDGDGDADATDSRGSTGSETGAPTSGDGDGDGDPGPGPGDPEAGFAPVAAELGLALMHHNVDAILAVGSAWADVDGDGDLDLALADQAGPNHLLLSTGGAGFVAPDWPGEWAARLDTPELENSGMVFADYDRDGWPDLLLLADGANALLRNIGGAGFEDQSVLAGIADVGEASHAAWGDYDGDGWLDFYVPNNGLLPAPPDRLYHNLGDGSFADASELLDLDTRARLGMSAVWFDYDDDGDADLYVANDKLTGNVLWRNDGPGCGGWCFTDVSAASDAGIELSSMGVAVGDYDNDGDQDLYITSIGDMALLQNHSAQGQPGFVDVAAEAGASVDTDGWGEVGWGTQFLDYDNDGWLDLFVGCGKMDPGPSKPNVLLHNLGDGTFAEVADAGGAAQDTRSFGVSTADYDEDGWVDLLVGNSGGVWELFQNQGGGHHWLSVELRAGPEAPVSTEAVGSRVYVSDDSGRTQVREVVLGSSYGSSSSLRLHFGLGDALPVAVELRWADGEVELFDAPPVDSSWVLDYPAR